MTPRQPQNSSRIACRLPLSSVGHRKQTAHFYVHTPSTLTSSIPLTEPQSSASVSRRPAQEQDTNRQGQEGPPPGPPSATRGHQRTSRQPYLGMQLGGVLSTSQVAKSFMGTGLKPSPRIVCFSAILGDGAGHLGLTTTPRSILVQARYSIFRRQIWAQRHG